MYNERRNETVKESLEKEELLINRHRLHMAPQLLHAASIILRFNIYIYCARLYKHRYINSRRAAKIRDGGALEIIHSQIRLLSAPGRDIYLILTGSSSCLHQSVHSHRCISAWTWLQSSLDDIYILPRLDVIRLYYMVYIWCRATVVWARSLFFVRCSRLICR